MARMARLVVPNYPHHVIQRGNRRQRTFFNKDDYLYYVDLIAEHSQRTKTEIWAYCLMPNHVHLIMVPSEEDGLRATLGEAHRKYTRRINFREGWRGHLWQERFHSFFMDENYLLAAVRYVELNPVAAKICPLPEDWQWSSARAHIDGQDDKIVSVKPMLDRVSNWYDYLSDHNVIDQESLIQKHLRSGRPLGSAEFISKLERTTGMRLTPCRPGPKPRSG